MEDVHNKILPWFQNVLQQNKRTFLQNLSFLLSFVHSFLAGQGTTERQGETGKSSIIWFIPQMAAPAKASSAEFQGPKPIRLSTKLH